MKFAPTHLPGVWLIHLECQVDSRGYFARAWCQEEFAAAGLNPRLVQCNLSFNYKRGTLRGMHYQTAPFQEAKLIRCTRGAIYDVALDLQPQSPTFKKWFAVELRPTSPTLLYIGEGYAHGFQTLEDDTEVFYQMSESYYPDAARGVRWNDPAFGIEWPETSTRILSERDASYPDYVC
jgi:dTDP-4-dehydrorhamnose 3,5-epimerase